MKEVIDRRPSLSRVHNPGINVHVREKEEREGEREKNKRTVPVREFPAEIYLAARYARDYRAFVANGSTPVTARSPRESKGFSPPLFYNASRFRGEKFPLETHRRCRLLLLLPLPLPLLRTSRRNFAKRPSTRPPARAVKFTPGLVTMLLKRAVLVIVRSAGENGEAEVSPRQNIGAPETRGNFRGADISASL